MSANNTKTSIVTVFAGKGGVGKTTCAATTAFHYASLGEKTLIISTDATPSLLHIFEKQRGEKPLPITANLYASELGSAEVKALWDKKFGREVYAVFSSFVSVGYEDFVEFMTSLLPGLSDEFIVDYIRELSRQNIYQHIVWDTAPLGQTLTLLRTPALLSEHLRLAPRIYSKLKSGKESKEPILDIIRRWQKLSAENMDFLKNDVSFNIVTIAEALAVEQLEGVFGELNRYSLEVDKLIINNLVKTEDSEFLVTKADEQKNYLKFIREKYADKPIIELPLFPHEIKGMERLKKLEKALFT